MCLKYVLNETWQFLLTVYSQIKRTTIMNTLHSSSKYKSNIKDKKANERWQGSVIIVFYYTFTNLFIKRHISSLKRMLGPESEQELHQLVCKSVQKHVFLLLKCKSCCVFGQWTYIIWQFWMPVCDLLHFFWPQHARAHTSDGFFVCVQTCEWGL